jgi:2-polyprenyl-3-methyl-5-hydroxy-6-metoxy-1,4-benzoquinol methylase
MSSNGVVTQSCLICSSSSYFLVKQFSDGVIVGRCEDCGFLYTPQRLAHPEALFADSTLEALRIFHAPLVSGDFQHYRRRAYRDYLALIGRHGTGRRLLDVGCADGFFLAEARQSGFTTMGVEPSSGMAAFAREELKLDVRDGRADQVDLDGAEFDVITMTDSLEYLPDPRGDLRRLTNHLAPTGLLFLKVPNGEYFELRNRLERLRGRREGGRPGGAFTPSLRVAHYTLATLRTLFEELEMTPIHVGAFPPIDSAGWVALTGLPLSIRPPWQVGFGGRVMRRMLHAAGLAEEQVTSGEHNHLSQSLVGIARPRLAESTADPQV